MIKKYSPILLFFLVLTGLFFYAQPAHAVLGVFDFSITDIPSMALDALDFVDGLIGKMFIWFILATGVTADFLGLSASLLEWASGLSVGLTNNVLVNAGWDFTTGLVNMIFILILVAIAFALILHKEAYGYKKALPRLIGVALLVNFSLLFVKIFVDLGWMVQNSFKESLLGGDIFQSVIEPLQIGLINILKLTVTQLMIYVAAAMIPGVNVFKAVWLAGSMISEAFAGTFSQTILFIIFGLTASIIFLIYTIFFLVRIAVIWLLAIAAPLAFVAFILPPTQKYFWQWFHALISWTFMGVVMLFLMGLGLKLFIVSAPPGGEVRGITGGWDFLEDYSKFIFLLIYLTVTLYAVKKFMPAGMNAVWSFGENLVKTGTGLATIQAIKAGLWASRKVAPRVEKIGERMMQKGEGRVGLGGWAQRRLGERIAIGGKGMRELTKEQQEKEVASQIKELEKLTPTQLAGRIKEAIGPQARAAAMAALYQKDAKKFQEQLDAKLFSEDNIVVTGKLLWDNNQKDFASTHPSEAMVKAIFPKEWEAAQKLKANSETADQKYQEYQNLANLATQLKDDAMKKDSDLVLDESKKFRRLAEDGKNKELELIQSITSRLKPNQWAQMPDQYFKDPLTQEAFARSTTGGILSEIGREKGQNMIDVVQETFDKIGFEPLAKINPRAALWLLSNAAQEQSGFRPPSDVKYTEEHDRDYYKQIVRGMRQEAAADRQELKGLIRREFEGREQMMFRNYHQPEATTERRLLIKELTEEMGKKLPTKEEVSRKIGSAEDAYNKAAKEAEKAREDLRIRGTGYQQQADDIISRAEASMKKSEAAREKRLKEMWEKK